MKLFNIIKKEKERIITLAIAEVKRRYAASFLGIFWALLEPFFIILIYSLVFPLILKSGFYTWVIYFIVGLIPYRFLRRGSIETSRVLVDYKNLMEKIKIEPEAVILSRLLSNIIYFLIELAIFLPVILLSRGFTVNILLLPFLIISTILFALSFGFMFSWTCKKYRDVEYILGVFFEAMMFLSPIVYQVNLIPKNWRNFYMISPFSTLIYSYDFIFFEKLPSFSKLYPITYTLIYSLLSSIALSIISYKIFLEGKKSEE